MSLNKGSVQRTKTSKHVVSCRTANKLVWLTLDKPCGESLIIHPCHTAAILSRETKRALFYHAKPRNGNHGDEA